MLGLFDLEIDVQVLEIRTESQEVLQSLTALSKLHHQNTAASRRQLKANVEERGIVNVEQFLSAAQGVIQVWSAVCYSK